MVLFNTEGRAARVAKDLTAASYRAYVKDLNLGARGHMYEVVVGPFASLAEAEAQIARIRAIPGYQDARLVSPTP